MSDRIRVSISITPIETLASSEDATKTRDIVSPVTNKSISSSAEIALGTLDSAAGWDQGSPAYKSASTSRSAIEGGGGATRDFLYIKHTGHLYSSSSALGAATTNTLDIEVYSSGEQDYVAIGRLQPGEAMIFPRLTETGAIFVSATTGSAIAVEYLAVT